MEQKVSVWKANLTNGVVFGLIGVIYSLLMYFLDLTLNKIQPWILLLILVVVLYYMIKSYRDTYLHGFITYGQSLGAGVIIFLYSAIISAIFTYILYKFIDPGLLARQLAMTEEVMVRRGTPQQALDAAMTMQRKIMVPEIMAPFSILWSMFAGTIISLIVSIFTRKEGNPLVDAPSN